MDARKEISWPGWEIVRRIGGGSFGTVYEIQRDIYGDIEKGALKVITIPHNEDEVDYLRCSGLDDASITRTFHQQVGDIAKEYKLMTQLRENPNIVRCDDFRDIQHDDGLGWDIYIKMELLTPLMKRLDKVSSEEQIIQMGMDICNALIDCQKKNIIHRDIKPQNVFVSESGRFKLGDFGIARTIERTTHATAGIGTYSYMAPEVERNEPYGKTADIYSLGLMIYWLLNERRGPFMPLPPNVPKYGDEEQARRRRFAGEQIPLPKNGSEKLKSIVLRACSFKPEDRFENAEEFYFALKSLIEKHSVVLEIERSSASATSSDDEDVTVGPGWEKKSEVNPMPNQEQEDDATVGPGWEKKSAADPTPNQEQEDEATVDKLEKTQKAEEKKDKITDNVDPEKAKSIVQLDVAVQRVIEKYKKIFARQKTWLKWLAGAVAAMLVVLSLVSTLPKSDPKKNPEPSTIVSIEVIDPPTATFVVGSRLKTGNMMLLLTYSDGTTEKVLNGYQCSPKELNVPGIQEITVYYQGFYTSFKVEVVPGTN